MASGLGVYALVWCLLAAAIFKHVMGATVRIPRYEENHVLALQPIFEAVFGIVEKPITADSMKMYRDAEGNEKSKLVAASFFDSMALYKSDAEEMVTEDVIEMNVKKNDVISNVIYPEVPLTANANTEINEEVNPKKKKPTTPKPHKRGEHVINNGVRKVLPKIIDSFLDQNKEFFHNQGFQELVQPGLISTTMEVYKAREHPLSPEAVQQITYGMVATVPQGQTPSDGNACMFGITSQQYVSRVVQYMSKLFRLAVDNPREIIHIDHKYTRMAVAITETVHAMCTYSTYGVFVDNQALGWWLNQGGPRERTRRMTTFTQIRNDVVDMFGVVSHTRGRAKAVTWVRELFHVYQRLHRHHI